MISLGLASVFSKKILSTKNTKGKKIKICWSCYSLLLTFVRDFRAFRGLPLLSFKHDCAV